MPELPEVETCRRQLERWGAGRTVVAVRALDPAAIRAHRSTHPDDAHPDGAAALAWLPGRRAGAARRHGKRAAWAFGDRGLLIHLGMTGKWVRRTDEAPPRFARLGIVLDDGATVWFLDARRFGCVVPVPADVLDAALRDGMGPDAWTEPPDGPALAAAISGRALKLGLLDQARLAGVGNIQAAEALWRARLSPWIRGDQLDDEAWARLATALHDQLAHTLAMTDDDEVVYLSSGGWENPFEVYGKAGAPCPRCGAPIAKRAQGGRSTFFCPACQPDP